MVYKKLTKYLYRKVNLKISSSSHKPSYYLTLCPCCAYHHPHLTLCPCCPSPTLPPPLPNAVSLLSHTTPTERCKQNGTPFVEEWKKRYLQELPSFLLLKRGERLLKYVHVPQLGITNSILCLSFTIITHYKSFTLPPSAYYTFVTTTSKKL